MKESEIFGFPQQTSDAVSCTDCRHESVETLPLLHQNISCRHEKIFSRRHLMKV